MIPLMSRLDGFLRNLLSIRRLLLDIVGKALLIKCLNISLSFYYAWCIW